MKTNNTTTAAITTQTKTHRMRSAGSKSQKLMGISLALALAATSLSACSRSVWESTATEQQEREQATTQEVEVVETTQDVQDTQETSKSTIDATSLIQTSADAVNVIDTSTLFSNRDLDSSYDAAAATRIILSPSSAKITGSGVQIQGTELSITQEGTYIISGSLTDGRIVIDVSDTEKVQLVFDGVDIKTSLPCALYVRNADKVFLTLASGSANALTCTGVSTTEDESTIDGAIFAHDDLTINGDGSLSVTSSQGHGIVGKDELTLVSGNVTVEAKGHAIQAKDSIAVASGTWTLTAGTDGLHASHDTNAEKGFIYICGGDISISASSDGMDASSALQIDGGTISVAVGDDGIHAEGALVINAGDINVTNSNEGIEGATITITGGSMDVVSYDDGLNASGTQNLASMMMFDSTADLLITGGTIVIDAQGDGLDSNGNMTIEGGEIYVSGPTNDGNGAIDVGDGAQATITGGIVIAAGSSGMAENFGSASTQPAALVALSGSAGSTITLTDSSGTPLASFIPNKAYSCVVVSAPGMRVGETYTLSSGSASTSFTMDSMIYSEVYGMGMGGPGMGGIPSDMGQNPQGSDGGFGGPQGWGGPGH